MGSVLTAQQERFVEAHLSGATNAEALAAAGYAPHLPQASKLLRKPHVQIAITERQQRLRDAHHVDRERLAVLLLEAHACAHTVADEIKAIRQLGLLFGLYEDTSR